MLSSDVVVVGSGHNGLVAGAYLAASGKRVLVLERNGWFGGGVVTRELTVPGFRHDQHSMAHIFIHANPLLAADELKLKDKYGLRYVFPDPPMMSVFEDGSTLAIYRDRERTCAEIAKFSKKDADAYRRLSVQAAAWLPMVAATLYSAARAARCFVRDARPEPRGAGVLACRADEHARRPVRVLRARQGSHALRAHRRREPLSRPTRRQRVSASSCSSASWRRTASACRSAAAAD